VKLLDRFRAWRLRRAEQRMEREHLRTFGCALWCPRCKTLLVERVMVLPLGNGDYRFYCKRDGCGFQPVFNFAIAPVPICMNKHNA